MKRFHRELKTAFAWYWLFKHNRLFLNMTRSFLLPLNNTLSMFTCTVKSSYGYSSIWPFNWTTVLVPVYMRWGRIDILSSSATVDGDAPCSAGWYLTLLWLAKQATNKLASNPCCTVRTWTTLQRYTRHIYTLLLVQIWCMLPPVLKGFLFSYWLFSYKYMLFKFWVKYCSRDLLIMRRFLRATPSPVEAHTCSNNSTSNHIILVC